MKLLEPYKMDSDKNESYQIFFQETKSPTPSSMFVSPYVNFNITPKITPGTDIFQPKFRNLTENWQKMMGGNGNPKQ